MIFTKIRGVRVEEYAYYVSKLHLKTQIWRQAVTSQKAHTKYKWPPYATEWTPPWKFSAYATACVSTICLVSVILQWFLLSTLHQLLFQIRAQLQISPKRTHPLIVSAFYMTVSLAYNLVPLESNHPYCKTTKQIFYNSTGCAPGTKKLRLNAFQKWAKTTGKLTATHASQKSVQLPSFMSKHAELPAF